MINGYNNLYFDCEKEQRNQELKESKRKTINLNADWLGVKE